MNNWDFQSQLAAQLEKAQINFEQKAAIKGFFADFVVYAPDERVALIETKSWQWHDGNVARAAELAHSIQERTGANVAFIVLENLDRNWPSKSVFTIDGIVKGIRGWIKQKAGAVVQRILTDRVVISDGLIKSSKLLFAAMPFDRKYDDTFVIAMTKAAEAIGSNAVRVDEEVFTEDIVTRIKSTISKSAVVVADLSKSKPNVLYELGYARGLDIPCVQICSTNLNNIPFDVAHYPTLRYDIGSVTRLVPNLVRNVKIATSATK